MLPYQLLCFINTKWIAIKHEISLIKTEKQTAAQKTQVFPNQEINLEKHLQILKETALI